ncbi:MAG TPA: MFS transporter [Solirubrobacterales bacterium]|jgi:MFS family permease|nr:MFS transporter [Solirubrobacterales bacterium]
MRRLLILASTMVFFDVAFYAAIAPLLPHYVSEFGLSEAQAGILQASYAAGTLAVSLPAGILAARIGPRSTVVTGLGLFGVSGLVFGFGNEIMLLDVARFCQGAAGALIWSGAFAWLIAEYPPERRGAVIGTVIGTAVAGALFGPLLGGVAAQIGTEPVFALVTVVAGVMAVLALRTPEIGVSEAQGLRSALMAMSNRPIVLATAFVAVPSLTAGAIEVLVPLRIDHLGGSSTLIAGGFVIGAAIEAVFAPISGRYSDRAGRRAPYVAGIAVSAVAMVGIAAAQSLGVVLGSLFIVALGAGLSFTPAITLLSEAGEAARLHEGFAAGLSNVAWASGQVVGAVLGGGLATVVGFAVPGLVVAALLAATAIYAAASLERGYPQPVSAE